MPKWSKTKEIIFSSDERVAIIRKSVDSHFEVSLKEWDEVSSHGIGKNTIRKLKEFEEQEEITFYYDPETKRIGILAKSDYPYRIALK